MEIEYYTSAITKSYKCQWKAPFKIVKINDEADPNLIVF